MPRRNRPKARRRSRKPAPLAVAAKTTTARTDRMALELVRTGKASAAILGSHKPSIERNAS